MRNINANVRTVFMFVVLLAVCAGCEPQMVSSGHTSGAASAYSREIRYSVDGSASLQNQGNATIITFGSHKIRVEKERLFLDDKESAKIEATVKIVEVTVVKGKLTVKADGTEILNTAIAE